MADNINIYFLGTSASTPTKSRNLTSLLINYRGSNYLFDASENVQQQILKTSQSIQKIKSIFITHFHGDHYYGLLGLLSSMSLLKREDELNIYVPFGYKTFLENFLKAGGINLSFKINILQIKSNQKIKIDNGVITSVKLDHTVPSYGYCFKVNDKIGKFNKQKAIKLKIPEGPLFSKLQEGKSIKVDGKIIKPSQVMDLSFKKQGKKILYFTDTAVLKKHPKFIESPDVLVHECTFLDEEKEKAKLKKHSSFSEVVSFSKKIKAKELYLVHVSSRYKDLEANLKNKKNISLPDDLFSLEIKDY
ncbi:MAG: ribonuclease Z [Candidatus ainarchaeum sp.]|nr:ribonuclease Z [Candidatus ainarchaeum sp.]